MSDGAAGDHEALMQTSRDWAAAVAAGDLERALSYWTDDAVVLPPDQPAVVGKAAIRNFVMSAFAIPGFSISWQPERAVLSIHGDMGCLIERNETTFNDEAGTLQTQRGKAVTIWQRQADGSWKCVVDTWNGNPRDRVF